MRNYSWLPTSSPKSSWGSEGIMGTGIENSGTSAAPLRDPAGKVAFIAGGSSGIGLGMARACSDAGMKVAITYLTASHYQEARTHFAGDHAGFMGLCLDVRDRHAVQLALDEVRSRFGNVHLLCNSAGVGVRTAITAATYDDWDFTLAVNLGGMINCLQAFLPHLLEHGEPAHIVAVASMAGLFHGLDAGVYTTTKFALVGMMEALCADLRPRGVGVSVACPGLVSTNILQSDRNRDPRPAPESVPRGGFMAAGMDPLECGRRILRGVRRNDLHILTHPEFRQGIVDRFEAIMASIADAEAVPPERLQAEQRVLRHPLYIAEKTRLKSA